MGARVGLNDQDASAEGTPYDVSTDGIDGPQPYDCRT